MIRLNLPREPFWLALPHGVRVKVKPLTTPIQRGAEARMIRTVREMRERDAEIRASGGTIEGLPNLDDPDELRGFSEFIVARCLAEFAIIEWEGVEAEDGQAAPVTREAVADLMLYNDMAEEFLRLYTAALSAVSTEGNVSRPAPNGTGAAGQDIAEAVPNATPPAPEANAA